MQTANPFPSVAFCEAMQTAVTQSPALFDIAAVQNIHSVILDIINAGYLPVDSQALIFEYPRPAESDPGMVAFFQTAEKLAKGIRTKTKPGKYIRRHFPQMPDSILRHYAALCEPVSVKFLTDAEMVEFMKNGADGIGSCMAKGSFTIHPYSVYSSAYGWKLAIQSKGGETLARALVNDESREFVRTYSVKTNSSGYNQECEPLAATLETMGYSRASGWRRGLKLARIETRDGDLVGPYIDGATDHVSDEGHYLTLTPYGEYCGDRQCGTFSGGSFETCPDCGARFDRENEGSWIDSFDRHVCDSCAGDYIYIEYRGVNRRYSGYYIAASDAVYIASRGEHIDPDNPPEWAVCLHDREWVDLDDAVYIESADEYYLHDSPDIVYANTGTRYGMDKDYMLKSDCFQCAYSGEWYDAQVFDCETLDGETYCSDNVSAMREDAGQATIVA
ncbi:MAG: hypothetical protein ACK5NY_03585 [Burkholderiaceae bacterium]